METGLKPFACGRCAECDGGRGYQYCLSPRGGTSPEAVNKPNHYIAKLNGREYEVADVCEAFDLNLRLGQVVQYILREKHKGGLEDLKKAKRWLGREIAKREGREGWE